MSAMLFATTRSGGHLTGYGCALAAIASLLAGSAAVAQSSGWVQRPESSWRRPALSEAGSPREIELRAVADGLDRVAAGFESLQDGRVRTEPVTDLLVRLKPVEHPVRAGPGSGGPGGPERSYVEAHVIAVIGGRISPAGVAQCRQFEGDVLVCTIECEGGVFGLRRGRELGEHHLVLGVPDPAADRDGGPQARSPGFRLSSCATRTAGSPLLLPRSGRLAAELRLKESR